MGIFMHPRHAELQVDNKSFLVRVNPKNDKRAQPQSRRKETLFRIVSFARDIHPQMRFNKVTG